MSCQCSKQPRQATCSLLFFFNDTATTEIYTLSLHDALPICPPCPRNQCKALRSSVLAHRHGSGASFGGMARGTLDRKSTRLNSSHLVISYAVFCLKKKKTQQQAVLRAQSDG